MTSRMKGSPDGPNGSLTTDALRNSMQETLDVLNAESCKIQAVTHSATTRRKYFKFSYDSIVDRLVVFDQLYINKLSCVCAVHKAPILNWLHDHSKQISFPIDIANITFDYFERLFELHQSSLSDLNIKIERGNGIGGYFVKIFPLLELYLGYDDVHRQFVRHFSSCVDSGGVKGPGAILKMCNDKSSAYGDLFSLLREPLCYVDQLLVFVNVLRPKSWPNSEDFVLLSSSLVHLQAFCENFHKLRAANECTDAVRCVEEQLIEMPEPLSIPGRRFLRSGIIETSAFIGAYRRKIFLFNDLLVYTDPQKYDISFKVKRWVPLVGAYTVDNPGTVRFLIEPEIPGRFKPMEIDCKNVDEKEDWLQSIFAAMLALTGNKHTKFSWQHLFQRGTLHYASCTSDCELADKILKATNGNRSYIDKIDKDGCTALHLAAYFGALDIVRLLIKNSSNVNIIDCNGRTPLCLAVMGGFSEIVEILIQGVDKDILRRSNSLHIASYCGFDDIVQILLSNGCDSNMPNEMGDTSLHLAAAGGHSNIIKSLVSVGACVAKPNMQGLTPIHVAVRNKRPLAVSSLIQSGCDISVKDTERGCSPIHFASFRGYVDVLQVLVDSGANVNDKSKTKSTALHWACAGGYNIDAVLFLLQNGAFPNCRDEKGFTPLHVANITNGKAISEMLVLYGARLDIEDNAGIAALNSKPVEFRDCLNAAALQWQAKRFKAAINLPLGTWIDDNADCQCLICTSAFNFFSRKHHCRICGILCCDVCSLKRLNLMDSLAGKGGSDCRICDACFNKVTTRHLNMVDNSVTEKPVVDVPSKDTGKCYNSDPRPAASVQRENFFAARKAARESAADGSSDQRRSGVNNKINQVSDEMRQNITMLSERNDRLEEMSDKSSKLRDASQSYLDMIRAYNQQQSQKKWYEF